LSEGDSSEEEYTEPEQKILERSKKTREFKEQPADPPPAEDSEESSSEETGKSQPSE